MVTFNNVSDYAEAIKVEVNKLYLVSYKDKSRPVRFSATESLVYASSPERAIELTLESESWRDCDGFKPSPEELKAIEGSPRKERVVWCLYKE